MNPVDELNLLLGIGPSRPQLPLTLRKSGYVPVRSLGKGSYGQALLVFHEPQQQYFVVKHLNLAGMSSRQRHDAHNEINILQKLHHPNIVRYVEYYEEHPHLYIVMEYADGGDVYSLLSSAQNARKMGGAAGGVGSGLYRGAAPPTATAGLLSEAQVVSLFVQTTMAVKYMHDRRLLHRDIKSSNIFLTKNHVVKLGDFGISTVLQSTVAMASTMCGTPCYFSPELCQGRPYNSKSDMWALGVLLYELCAGHVPFESTTMKALMRDIVHKQPLRIPGVYSTELWELVVQLLQKDARRRPDAGQVLLSPVLMKHVPDLINQLAEDTAQSASAAAPTAAAAAAAGPHAAPPASPSPPPPPRRQVHSQVQEPASAAPAPPPAAAAAAARSPQPSPFVPPAVAAAAAPLAPAGGAAAARQRGSPNAGAASIGALLARFDEEKQRIAEAKQQRRASQHEGSGGTGTGTGSDAGGAGPDGAPPRLSPGAAAALRQQGVQVPGGAEVATGAAGAAVGRVQRAPFIPPPLPAALRGSAVAGAAGGPDAAAAPRPAAAVIAAADRPASELRLAPSQEGRSEGGASRARSQPPTPQPPASNASSSAAAAAAGGGATPAGPTVELSAMLSELSSWRERSVRRQQRHSDESGGGGGGGAARSAGAGAGSRPQASSPQAAQPRRTSDGVAVGAPAPQPPPSPSAASPRPQLEKMSNGGGAAAARQPSPARGRSPAKTPASSPAAGADAARASAQSPAVPATKSPQKAVAPTRGAASTPATPGAAGSGKSLQPKQAKAKTKDAAPLSPTAVAPLTPATRGDASDMAAAAAAERSSSSSASGQSFVDALGTTLDVDAIQAAAAAADAGRQAQASVGAGNASQLSGLGGPQQMTMKKTFQGTSQKIQSMQSTLMAGSVLRHVPSAGNAVGADGGDDDVEGAADVRFTTGCLCGGAATSHGCLSMIYGSFICACDVCARFTGAPHGVEWLHLPELAAGMPALLPPAPPRATGSGSPTAGTGAAAATALRAQSGGASASSATTARMATGAGSAEKSSGGRVTGNARASASASVTARSEAAAAAAQLAQAGIRAYEYHCSTALSTSLIAVGEGNAVAEVGAPGVSQGRTSPTTSVSGGSAAMAVYVIYSCLTCGSLMGMQHEGVEGLLVPKLALDAQSLAILSSCAQTVDLDASRMTES